MIDIPQIAKYVTAVGVIIGAGFAADERYAPASTVSELQSQLQVDRIFRLVDEAQANGSPAWLCNALDAEFVELCTNEPEHYLCGTEARHELKAKAGCP